MDKDAKIAVENAAMLKIYPKIKEYDELVEKVELASQKLNEVMELVQEIQNMDLTIDFRGLWQ